MKSRGKEQGRLVMAALAIVLLLMAAAFYYLQGQERVLRIGIFAGSNWEVPQGNSYAVIDAAVESLRKDYPHIRVEYVSGIKKEDYAEWLAEQVMGGREPDVFFVLSDDFNLYASMGALMDLSGFIAEDGDFRPENYYKAALDYGKYEGISYALPCESVPTLMFVNKSLLASEGISMPGNDWTWQDFFDICRRVTKDTDGDGVLDQFGCYDYTWKQAAVTNGVHFFREDGRISYFADKRMEEAVRFMMELRTVQRGREIIAKDFDMGRVAFRPFSFAEYRTYKPYPWRIKKYMNFEWDCIKLPAGPSGSNTSELDSLLVGMSARTRMPKIAWDFMKKLCYDPEIQTLILQKSQGMPVRRDVLLSQGGMDAFRRATEGGGNMDILAISEVMDGAVMPPKFKGYRAAMLYADTELTKIINGTISFNNALNKLQKEVNAMLQF